MGYRMSYSEQITVSGVVSGSYPSSQSGGSLKLRYSESVPININIYVDSDPFDVSVNSCNYTINSLTGTITGMNAAQCVAIEESSQQISDSMIKGFYGMINSELSSQMAVLNSNFKVKITLIMAMAKEIQNRKNIMDNDYMRITSRYYNIFTDLDNEVQKRITALDTKVFNLSVNVQQEILKRSATSSAGHFTAARECYDNRIIMLISNLYKKTKNAITNMYNYISQEETFSENITRSLDKESNAGSAEIFIPVILAESDILDGEGESVATYSSRYCAGEFDDRINSEVMSYCSDSTEWFDISDAMRKQLDNEFNTIAEVAFANGEDERLYKTIMRLWNDTALKVLHKEH